LNYVRFIHRSAGDFLRYTKEGRDILAFDLTTTGQRNVKRFESRIFASLVGLGESEALPEQWMELSDLPGLDETQLYHLLGFVEQAFFRLLEDLEVVRGSKVHYGTRSLSQVAKKIMDDFTKNMAGIGYIPAVRNYVAWVKARGEEVTNTFMTFILFSFIEVRRINRYIVGLLPDRWMTCDHDIVLWLLNTGADSIGSEPAWNWSRFRTLPFY
jgi:hypothetical protein